jgi:hypothetical protein
MIILSKGPTAVVNEVCDNLCNTFGMTHVEITKDINDENVYCLRASHIATGPCPTGQTAKTRNFYQVLAIKDELLSRGVGCKYMF